MITLSIPTTHCLVCIRWIVAYVIDYRGGGPSSGYISESAFSAVRQRTHRSLYLSLTRLVGLILGRIEFL